MPTSLWRALLIRGMMPGSSCVPAMQNLGRGRSGSFRPARAGKMNGVSQISLECITLSTSLSSTVLNSAIMHIIPKTLIIPKTRARALLRKKKKQTHIGERLHICYRPEN